MTYCTNRFATGAAIRKFNITNFVAPIYNETEGNLEYDGKGSEDNNDTTFGHSFYSNATL